MDDRVMQKKCDSEGGLKAEKWWRTPWSVQAVVAKAEKEWGNRNARRRSLALGRLEREVLFAGEHPVRFCASVLLLLLVCAGLGLVLPEDWFSPVWSSWQASEHLTHFSTLWSVQATIAALVYPIVIAFVAVFLQRRPFAEAFVHLYILDSGALASGLSSLSLVVVMAVQYVLLSTHGTAVLPLWVAFDSAWFLLNAVLTTYFLYRTVEFLRPEVQSRLVSRYTVNVALPRDVRRLYSFQVLARSQTKGWIPAPSAYDEKTTEGPKVLLSRFSTGRGESQGWLEIREPSRLVDVRLWMLRTVVSSWMRAARRQLPPPVGGSMPYRKSWPVLTVPMSPGMEYTQRLSIASVESGPRLRRWQLQLLRWAYVFQPVRTERFGIGVQAILSELEHDARAAAAVPDNEAFERAYEALLGLHEVLLEACLVTNEDDLQDSLALLPDVGTFAERPLHEVWSDSYRSVFTAAIGSMERDTAPARRLCHLVQHLDSTGLRSSPLQVRQHVLRLPPLMMYLLSLWWVRRVEEQGVMEHSAHQMVVLRAPTRRVYDEVVSTFVGGWESARQVIADVPEGKDEFDWANAADLGRLHSAHLHETARMLLAAVARGDQLAAEWLADVLSKWWGPFAFTNEPFAIYGKTTYLTLEHLRLDWPAVCDLLGIKEEDFRWREGKAVVQRAVLLAALQNLWTDIRLLVVELLFAWAAENSPPPSESLAVAVAAGLLAGRQWRSGGEQSEPLSQMGPAVFLDALSRQFASDGKWRSGYIGTLDQFVSRIKDMERPDMITSRVYSFSGADDVASLTQETALLFAFFSDGEWGPNEGLRRQVDRWFGRQYESVDILHTKVPTWVESLERLDEPHRTLLGDVLRKVDKSSDVSERVARAVAGVRSILEFIEGRRVEVLAAEPVEPERLDQLGRFASEKAFRKESGRFPMQLFESVQYEDSPLVDFTLTSRGVRKGELTRTEMDQRAGNEASFWAETMSRQVAAVVLRDVIGACQLSQIRVKDAAAYWAVLKAEAAGIAARGERPILLLDNATRPEWVWEWQHADYGAQKHSKPEDLQVQRREGRGDGYVCDFNDIEIYVAPITPGQSLLLPREVFDDVTFQQFGDHRFVEAEVAETENKLLVDLKMRFSRRVTVRARPGFWLVYGAPSASSSDQPLAV